MVIGHDGKILVLVGVWNGSFPFIASGVSGWFICEQHFFMELFQLNCSIFTTVPSVKQMMRWTPIWAL